MTAKTYPVQRHVPVTFNMEVAPPPPPPGSGVQLQQVPAGRCTAQVRHYFWAELSFIVSTTRGAFHQVFCQCFSLTNFISYWNPCIWLAESKFVSEKHWQNAWWNAPLKFNLVVEMIKALYLSYYLHHGWCQIMHYYAFTWSPKHGSVPRLKNRLQTLNLACCCCCCLFDSELSNSISIVTY